MDIVVFGAGSLGSLVGGALAGAADHEVTLVGRADHVDAIREGGLRVDADPAVDADLAFEGRVRPAATTDGADLEAELAVVTVKSFDTGAAARTLATGTFDAALSLQNGMGNEATLSAHLPCPVLAGTATYGAVRPEPGVVVCTGIGEIVLGPREGGSSAAADAAGEAFRAAALETSVAADMPRRLWEKLAINAGINPVTALARIDNGGVLEAPANDLARAATRETARTARAADVRLSNREALAAMEAVADATAANTSSMLQDVDAGRRTEVDAITGYVAERASERGLEAPVTRTLTALLRSWEVGRGLR